MCSACTAHRPMTRVEDEEVAVAGGEAVVEGGVMAEEGAVEEEGEAVEEAGVVAEVDEVVLVRGEDVNSSAGKYLINSDSIPPPTHTHNTAIIPTGSFRCDQK